MKTRRAFSILVCVCMLISMMPANPLTVFAAGQEGTAENPIEIGTAAQLIAFAERVNSKETTLHAKLTENISLNNETFTFDPDTGLVTVTDGEHTAYLGTGIKGASGGNTVFDTYESNAGLWYGSNTSNVGGSYSGEITVWSPIGSNALYLYTGTFDGNGKTISGLYANSALNNIGLFGYSEGTIKNVGVTDSYLYGSDHYVSGVCAQNRGTVQDSYNTGIVCGNSSVGGVCAVNRGTIKSCYNTGTVSGTEFTGGVCGSNGISSGNIEGCYNTGLVSGTEQTGGVCGQNSGTVNNCYNTGSVCGGSNYTGGVCGYCNGTTKNSYNTGSVSGNDYVGGVCGDDYGTKENLYYLSTGAAGVGVSKTENEFHSGEVCYLLNGSRSEGTTENPLVWYQTVGEGYPAFSGLTVYYVTGNCSTTDKVYSNTPEVGENGGHNYVRGICSFCGGYLPAVEVTAENREELGLGAEYEGFYAIDNAGTLLWFGEQVAAGNNTENAVLLNDIEFSSTQTYGSVVGTRDYPFRGHFDGRGMRIKDLNISGAGSGLGLFGYISSGAVIENMNYFSGSVTGTGNYVGSLIGIATTGNGASGSITVRRCQNHVPVTGSRYVGGLISLVTGEIALTMENCFNTGNVTGTDPTDSGFYKMAGGICSSATSTSVFRNCYCSGAVSGAAYRSFNYHYLLSGSCTVENCYFTEQADGRDDQFAGTTQIPAGKVTSGELCYLLNSSVTNGTQAYYQTVGEGFPAFSGKTVYYAYPDCTATEKEYLNTSHPEQGHNFVNGICIYCGEYAPETLVTNDNYTALELTADYIGYYAIDNAGQLLRFADKVNGGDITIKAVLTDDITLNDESFTFDPDTGLVTVTDGKFTAYLGTGVKGDTSGSNTTFDTETSLAGTWYSDKTGGTGAYSGALNEWMPIGSSAKKYNGIFDGNNKTVSGLYLNNSTDYQGLFGCVNVNGHIKKVGVTNSFMKGKNNVGGVCGYNRGTVTDCQASGVVIGGDYVGGVCGYNYYNCTITGCYNSGSVSGSGNNTGGVCGHNYNSGTVTDCRNTGDILGNQNVGGVCGNNLSGSTLTGCYNTGTINGNFDVGGVCGSNSGTVNNCFNTEAVSGKSVLGGVCGDNLSSSTVTGCYNTGSVSGSGVLVGGVCGNNTGDTVTNCYYLTDCAKNGSNTIQFGMGNGAINYITPDTAGVTTAKTAGEFSSGEVTYLLNGSRSEGTTENPLVWYQTCGEEVPAFSGETVYSYTDCNGKPRYTNDSALSGTVLSGHLLIHHEAKAATCTEAGNSAYDTCSRCDYTTFEVVPATGHSGSNPQITVAPTCTDEGAKTDTCSVCGTEYTEVIPATGHDFRNGYCNTCGAIHEAVLTLNKYDINGDGKFDKVYEISDAGQLAWFAAQVNGGDRTINAILTGNITLNDESFTFDPDTGLVTVTDGEFTAYLGTGIKGESGGNATFDTEASTKGAWYSDKMGKTGSYAGAIDEWTPIGSNGYYGFFDGNGKTVSGVYINNSANNNGLFRYYGGSLGITDLGVINSFIRGTSCVGGVCGQNSETITYCYNTGTVFGESIVGGVCGYNNGGTLTDCYNTGAVDGESYVGGVCGHNNYSSTIIGCYNTGSVSGSTYYVGGVCGRNEEKSTIEHCFNTGSVSGSFTIGGVCGRNENESTIEHCFNTGSVSGSFTIGGVCGCNFFSGTLTYCYNTGTVIGENNVGGVCGDNYNATLANCYYLTGCAKDGTNTVQFGVGNGLEGDTTPDTAGKTTAKTELQFHSGEVAWLLQNGVPQDTVTGVVPLVWGQSDLGLSGSLPELTGNEQKRVFLFGEPETGKYLSKVTLFGYDTIRKTALGYSAENGGLDLTDADVMYRADLNADGVIDVFDASIAEQIASGNKRS